MAGLKKPVKCKCGSINLHREYGPERWICECGIVVRSRNRKPDQNTCRDCGASRDDKEFKNGKNQCLECYNQYMVEWRTGKGKEKYLASRSTRIARYRAKGGVKKAIQRSPEAFIKYLARMLHRPSALKNKKWHMSVEIDFDHLWALYQEQKGLCAVTQLPLIHKMGDLCSISIDRIDSSEGYVPGNVHLVCQWVNHAKRHHSLDDFKKVLEKL